MEITLIIGYDSNRGEPRGKTTNPVAGSCVDCLRGVKVCPTGIDIRNGLQMKCNGCAACIDACDDIMVKLNRPTGLVRYDSSRGLAGEKRRIFRPRLLAYGLLGLLGLIALGVTAFSRAKPMNADVSRMRGPSFYVDPSVVRNHFQLRLFNKRNEPGALEAAAHPATGRVHLRWQSGEMAGKSPVVLTASETWGESMLAKLVTSERAAVRVPVLERLLKYYLIAVLCIVTEAFFLVEPAAWFGGSLAGDDFGVRCFVPLRPWCFAANGR